MNELSNLLTEFNNEDLSIVQFVLNLLLTLIISYILGWVYARYGSSLSNRQKLRQSLIILSMATMVIITIVKSSLALSLGLVGALSIVRFRTAVKETEELVYLFVAITIGLGLGADQKLITLTGICIILGYLIFTSKKTRIKEAHQNLILHFASEQGKTLNEREVISTIEPFANSINLRRVDEIEGVQEIALNVSFSSMDNMLKSKEALAKLGNFRFSFFENH